jgi:hypothetical protein
MKTSLRSLFNQERQKLDKKLEPISMHQISCNPLLQEVLMLSNFEMQKMLRRKPLSSLNAYILIIKV